MLPLRRANETDSFTFYKYLFGLSTIACLILIVILVLRDTSAPQEFEAKMDAYAWLCHHCKFDNKGELQSGSYPTTETPNTPIKTGQLLRRVLDIPGSGMVEIRGLDAIPVYLEWSRLEGYRTREVYMVSTLVIQRTRYTHSHIKLVAAIAFFSFVAMVVTDYRHRISSLQTRIPSMSLALTCFTLLSLFYPVRSALYDQADWPYFADMFPSLGIVSFALSIATVVMLSGHLLLRYSLHTTALVVVTLLYLYSTTKIIRLLLHEDRIKETALPFIYFDGIYHLCMTGIAFYLIFATRRMSSHDPLDLGRYGE